MDSSVYKIHVYNCILHTVTLHSDSMFCLYETVFYKKNYSYLIIIVTLEFLQLVVVTLEFLHVITTA